MKGAAEESTRRQVGGPGRTILLVDDEPLIRRALARDLERSAVRVLEAEDAAEALHLLECEDVGLVIADHRMPGSSGIDLLERVRERWPEVGRVLISGFNDPGTARDAINRAGIAYFLEKPWDERALAKLVDERLPAGNPATHPATTPPASLDPRTRRQGVSGRFPGIIGESRGMCELLELVFKVADTDSTVLVTGETGTGKELIGRAIHQASRRHGRCFSAVNSAAFPETLLESELFGHQRGAFTGASATTRGLFEQADKGTVFLDEVAEMPLSMQAKLLRFLQTGEIRPVGGESTRYVDVRLVTATNKDLEREVENGRFREDLFYRLAVIPIHVPPLRERPEDIPLLSRHFLREVSQRSGKDIHSIDDAAIEILLSHDWPGNVRELENVIERGVALCRGHRISLEDLPRRLHERPAQRSAPSIQSLPGVEREHILQTLDQVGWNRKRAAELLQISTTTLWRRLKEFGIEPGRNGVQRAGSRITARG